jgi:hypothetical protein
LITWLGQLTGETQENCYPGLNHAPKTTLRHDHFHFIRDLKDCARYLRNQVASKTTAALKLVRRAEKAQDEQKKKERSAAASIALTELVDSQLDF